MVKNKKAWLRIVEAVMAVVIILSVVIVLYGKNIEKPEKSDFIYSQQEIILTEISENPELRNAVITGNTLLIESFVNQRKPSGFNYSLRICSLDDVCGFNEYKKEIFSSERIISSTLQDYAPKKLKLFTWIE